jgi:hydrogenase/urease accessory protein HupE
MGKLKSAVITIGSVFLPAAAQAHSGPHRGDLGWSLIHIFGQSDHLLTVATVSIVGSMFFIAFWFAPWRDDSSSR